MQNMSGAQPVLIATMVMRALANASAGAKKILTAFPSPTGPQRGYGDSGL